MMRRGGRAIFHWAVVSSHGLAGFYVTAHGVRLNRQLIAVHRSRHYRYVASHVRSTICLLHVILTDGSQLTRRFG
jgi:hypothetical protein